jgi:hypothetical protein
MFPVYRFQGCKIVEGHGGAVDRGLQNSKWKHGILLDLSFSNFGREKAHVINAHVKRKEGFCLPGREVYSFGWLTSNPSNGVSGGFFLMFQVF